MALVCLWDRRLVLVFRLASVCLWDRLWASVCRSEHQSESDRQSASVFLSDYPSESAYPAAQAVGAVWVRRAVVSAWWEWWAVAGAPWWVAG